MARTSSHGEEDDNAPQHVLALIVLVGEGPKGDEQAHRRHSQHAGNARLPRRVGQDEHEATGEQQPPGALDDLEVVPRRTIRLRYCLGEAIYNGGMGRTGGSGGWDGEVV